MNQIWACGKVFGTKLLKLKNITHYFEGLDSVCDIKECEHALCIRTNDRIIIYNNQKKEILSEHKLVASSLTVGIDHFLCLVDNVPYSFGFSNYLCLGRQSTKPKEEPHPVDFFIQKNIPITQCYATGHNCLFITKNNELYGCGKNEFSELGIIGSQNLPKLVRKNVKRAWVHGRARHTFIEDLDGKIYRCGKNDCGQLGTGTQMKVPEFLELTSIKGDLINIYTSYGHTLIHVNNNSEDEIYTSGFEVYNGLNGDRSNKQFQIIEDFVGNQIHQISVGNYTSLILLTNNGERELWGFGYNDSSLLGNFPSTVKKPTKIIAPDIMNNPNFKFQVCPNTIYYFIESNSPIREDFKIFFEAKEFSDHVFFKFKVHKQLLELRVGKKIEEIDKIFQEVTDSAVIETFLKWVYYGHNIQDKPLLKILNQLQIPKPNEKSLENDLIQWYKDEDSKDFNLIVIDDEDEEEEEIEIPVHKLILCARSGLFREMFKNTTEKSNSVRDYSGKSEDSIEIFFQYLYTDQIELTADHDPELIIEELEDAVDYFQLNPSINLMRQFSKYKK
ncbi:hypothetical protein M0812_25292 [Anaeramoeba flamelloides]|uniref:BTB domain-containing protein n=1 Tax=Anaeramoeba flamelloides TaxID=1746091 RepID=A0AAV7YDX8_9EUKA|nr:hypothetical protein M0812_25292 [Anaeramoeba flamelloides]